MKICIYCNIQKSYDFFSFHNKSKDGRQDKCKECVKKYMKDRYAKTKHIQLEKQKEYHLKNKDKRNLSCIEYKEKNKEKCNELVKQWKQKNPHKVTSLNALRRATKRQATPKWLTDIDLWMLDEAYELAKLRKSKTKVDWHVDHIVPLVSNIVCGFHVPWNIQVIEARQNLVKHNKFEIL
jgi:hypothetical protein